MIITSAHRERDREEHALWRVALSFLLASTIVVTFGTLALRLQRKESEAAKKLAVTEAVHARDDRLVQADKLATLGTLAAGIAHQVATPLGVIVARAERLAPPRRGRREGLAGGGRHRRASPAHWADCAWLPGPGPRRGRHRWST